VWDWTLVRIMWMSVHREKVSKDRQGFIERVFDCFGWDLRRLQLFFLNDAGKYCWVNKRRNCSFVDHGNLLLCKEVLCMNNQHTYSVFCITYLKMPGYRCQRSTFFCDYCLKISPVTRGGAGEAKPPHRKIFALPWKNVLDIVQKYWT